MDCPACDEVLSTALLDGIEVDACPKCHGVWFDNDELRQAKDLADPNLNWLDFEIWKTADSFAVQPAARTCPKCDRGLTALKYEPTQVEIDYCTECRGVWLDENELHNIIEALKHEIARMPSREYLAAVIEEAVEIVNGPEPLHREWKDFAQVLKLLNLRVMIEAPALHRIILGMQQGSGPLG